MCRFQGSMTADADLVDLRTCNAELQTLKMQEDVQDSVVYSMEIGRAYELRVLHKAVFCILGCVALC